MASLKIALAVDSMNPDVGDLFLNGSGNVELTQNLSEEVAQELWIRLHFFKGEWFLDPTLGVPYLQTILGQKAPLSVIGQVFRSVILSVPGISKLDMFKVERTANRGLALTFAVRLTDGAVLTSADFAPFVIGDRG